MATYSRVKTFVANETLTASDLNAEFNNIITNTNSGNLNSDNVSTSSAWTWTGYHTYSTSSRIALSDDIYMTLGNATDGDYRVRYNATSTALEIMSTDSDGAGTDAVVLDIQDGTDDLRLRGGFSTDNNTAPTSGIVTGGNIVSDTDSTDDLGTTSVRWANLYVDAATITNNLTVGGTLTLTGGLTLNGNVTVGDNASDTLTINSTITSNLLFTDNTYDIGASGATRPRDLFLSRNAVMGGTLGVTGLITATGGVSGVLTGDVTGNLTGNVTGNVTGNLTGDVTGNISGNVTGGTISGTTGTFSGDLTVDTNILKVDSVNNSVGFGLTNPSDYAFNGTPSWVASGGASNASVILVSGTTSTGYLAFADGTTGTDRYSGNIQYNHSTNTMSFRTNGGVEAMTINSAQDLAVDTDTLFVDASADRVGINTSSPTASLTVAGPNTATSIGSTSAIEILDGNADNEFVNLRFATGANGSLASIGAKATTTGAYPNSVGELHFAIQNGSTTHTAMVIDSSQRVGIGTASPTRLLSLYSNSPTSVFQSFTNSSTGNTASDGAQIGIDSNNDLQIGQLESGKLIEFYNNGSLAMVIDSSQRVGIGTDSPSQKLHVYSDTPQALLLERSTAADQYINYKNSSRTWSAGLDEGVGWVVAEDAAISNSQRLVVAQGGNVGIGTSSPSLQAWRTNTYLTINNGTDGGVVELVTSASDASSNEAGAILWGATGNTTNHKHLGGIEMVTDGSTATQRGAYMRLLTKADGTAQPTERLRIDSSGNLIVGKTTTSAATAGASISYTGAATFVRDSDCLLLNRPSTTGTIAAFRQANTEVGTISVTASATAYNTTSDYRLKENIVGITDGITRIKSLKPSRFNFIAEADRTVDGFVAHEVSDVVPEAISGAKDAVDDEGNPQYQGIDQSKLIPLLTAALQEAITKIETLETKVAALEAA